MMAETVAAGPAEAGVVAGRPRLPSDPRARTALVYGALAVGALVYTQFILPGPKGVSGTPVAILFLNAVQGLLYALLAATIVLVYRTERFLNFASLAVGLPGAIFTVFLIRLTPTPFVIALLGGLFVGALLGALFDIVFVQRFFNAPRLTLTVVTLLSVGALTLTAIIYIVKLPFFPKFSRIDPDKLNSPIGPKLPFPGLHFGVGGLPLRFGFAEVFAMWTILLCLLGLGAFFRYTRAGVAVRAVAENPERAELLGMSTRVLSTLVWTICGFLSAAGLIASVFLAKGSGGGTNINQEQAVDLLLIPLAAAVVGRLRSLPVTAFVAIGLSVLTGAISFSYPDAGGVIPLIELAVLGLGLFFQRRTLLRSEARTEGGWAASEEIRPIPRELAGLPAIRATRYGGAVAVLLVVIFLPFVSSTRFTRLTGEAILFGIVAISLVMLTGWAGQVSLGQVGFMGIAAVASGAMTYNSGLSFWLATLITVALSSVVALFIGLPALRVRGLFLAAVTFGFAIVVNQFLFDRTYFKWLLPDQIRRPTLFFLDFADERSMYFLCLFALVVSVLVATNLRRSRFGRTLIAMRDNEAALQAAGISVVRTKLTVFMVSGALAGLAGALFGAQQRGVDAGSFTTNTSFILFAFVVVGGVTSVGGALLGVAVYYLINRAATPNNLFGFLFNFAPLLVLYVVPGGLMSILVGVRDSVLRIIAQRRQIVVPSLFADYDPEALERRLVPLAPASEKSGLGALPAGTGFRMGSELYGSGRRAVASPLGDGGRGRREEAAVFRRVAAAAEGAEGMEP